MKCIVREGIYQRVDNETAEIRLKQGWDFAPKSEWKKNTRDVKSETVTVADTNGLETKNKKAKKNAKLKIHRTVYQYTRN